jgi:hypothetical protein
MIVDVGLRRFSGNAIRRQALLILQSYGADAHSYIPGVGTVSGLVAGNWGDSAGTIPATKDGVVGKVDDANSNIDLTQATTANKPFLHKGAVNLVLRSEEFDNAAWGKTRSSITPNSTIAPNGTLTADKLVEDTTASNTHQVSQNTSLTPVSTPINGSVYLKAGERTFAQVRLWDNAANINGTSNYYDVAIDLTDGSTGTTNSFGSPSGTSFSVTNVGDGWYRLALTLTKKADATRTDLLVYSYTSKNAAISPIYTGDGTSGIYVWGAMLETGATVSTYVKTVATPVSNGNGNYHWVFDSTDLLSGTFPAGYESATIIDARSTGTVTQTAQNIVGTYSIGTSVDTYGRFIFRTGLTASETVIMQQFANSLRGF